MSPVRVMSLEGGNTFTISMAGVVGEVMKTWRREVRGLGPGLRMRQGGGESVRGTYTRRGGKLCKMTWNTGRRGKMKSIT